MGIESEGATTPRDGEEFPAFGMWSDRDDLTERPKPSSPSCGRKSGGCGASRGRNGAGYKFRISTGASASAGSNPNTRP